MITRRKEVRDEGTERRENVRQRSEKFGEFRGQYIEILRHGEGGMERLAEPETN